MYPLKKQTFENGVLKEEVDYLKELDFGDK